MTSTVKLVDNDSRISGTFKSIENKTNLSPLLTSPLFQLKFMISKEYRFIFHWSWGESIVFYLNFTKCLYF